MEINSLRFCVKLVFIPQYDILSDNPTKEEQTYKDLFVSHVG